MATTAQPPSSSSKRERTRAGLVAAGRALITEKGVSGLRIQEITERAGVALGSFYNYFGSKEDLVDAIVGESLHAVAEALAAGVYEQDQDPAELVFLAVLRFVSIAYEDPDFARLVVHLNHADALFMEQVDPPARRVVEEGVARGRFKVADVDVATIGIRGGALALMRSIVDGRVGRRAALDYAESCVRSLGLTRRRGGGGGSLRGCRRSRSDRLTRPDTYAGQPVQRMCMIPADEGAIDHRSCRRCGDLRRPVVRRCYAADGDGDAAGWGQVDGDGGCAAGDAVGSDPDSGVAGADRGDLRLGPGRFSGASRSRSGCARAGRIAGCGAWFA